MQIKKILKYFSLFLALLLISIIFTKIFDKKLTTKNDIKNDIEVEIDLNNSNVFLNVNYVSTDLKGNKYTLKASKGKIDNEDNDYIFLEDVDAVIELINSEIIKINSKFGKYNISNNNTIFSENVLIEYNDYKINGEILDFSMENKLIKISKNLIIYNKQNILKADTMELDIQTKDINISMDDNNKKVNLTNLY